MATKRKTDGARHFLDFGRRRAWLKLTFDQGLWFTVFKLSLTHDVRTAFAVDVELWNGWPVREFLMADCTASGRDIHSDHVLHATGLQQWRHGTDPEETALWELGGALHEQNHRVLGNYC